MEKPFSIIYDETKNTVAQTLANSGLPSVVLRDMMIAVVENLDTLAKQQLEYDKQSIKQDAEAS